MVYLIHFEQKYKHAGHYLGYTNNLERRMKEHRDKVGARLIEVIENAGIDWKVVRVWDGDRDLEGRLKSRHNGPRLCPICQARIHAEEVSHELSR